MPPCAIHKLSEPGSHEQHHTTPHIIFCHAHPVCPLPDQTQSTTCSSCKQSESGFVGAPSQISRTKMAMRQMQRKQPEKQSRAIVDVYVSSDVITFSRDTFPTISPRRFALQVVMVCDPAHTTSYNLKVGDQNWQAFANISQHQRQSVGSAKPPLVPNQGA